MGGMKRAWILVVLAGCSTVETGGSELLVGTCTVDITPPVGYRLGGYFKDRFAKEIRDPLYAKAVVFAQGSTRAAIVTTDLVGVPAWITDTVRRRAEGNTGIPVAHIAIAGTHTHTGPYLPRDPEENEYLRFLVDRLVEAIHGADFGVQPARLWGRSVPQSPALSFNRRHLFKDGKIRTIGPVTRHLPDHEPANIVKPAGPIDPDLGLILVRDTDRVRAVLSVFALHCNTVGDTTKGEEVVSADYPAFLERDLRRAYGPQVVSLFGAGTCGDINYVDPGAPGMRTSEEIGASLARTVVTAEPMLRPLRPSLAVRRATFDAPLQRFPADKVEQAKKDIARPKEIPFYQLVEANSILDIEKKAGKPYPLEVQAFRLDAETAIVAIPGEVFVELGLAIRRASPFPTTLVIELANDNGPAYIPTRKAFEESGYEVLASRLAAGGGEKIVDEAVKLLRELAR
jgi:neutral ceramidase